MNRKNELKHDNCEVKFWLSPEEKADYDQFLAPFGGKRGPFVKALLLKHLKLAKEKENEN